MRSRKVVVEVEKGFRDRANPNLYRAGRTVPSIQPDTVSSSMAGYFRIPAIWVGVGPSKQLSPSQLISFSHEAVAQRTLKCGLGVTVFRTGYFAFDFFNFARAPQRIIPGYSHPKSGFPFQVPAEHTRAEVVAANDHVLRTRILNAHQALQTLAESLVHHRTAMPGIALGPSEVHEGIGIDDYPSYSDSIENVRSLAEYGIALGAFASQGVPVDRRIIELEVVNCSLDLLDNLLLRDSLDAVLLLEEAFYAEAHCRDARYGAGLVAYWTIVEQLISIKWERMIVDQSISGERKKKLAGRDYTASIRIETLFLVGRISEDLYRKIEIARKARNNWAHSMHEPSESALYCASSVASALFQELFELPVQFNAHKFQGGASWPVWLDQRASLRYPPEAEK